MAQMANQKKTELIDYFHLVWTEKSTSLRKFFENESHFSPILETSIRHKNSKKGPTFSSKIPEKVDIETIKWHTPVRKYHESPPPGD